MESYKRACRYFYYRFIRLQASPENLARGVALGLFISTTPTMGFQTFIALFFAAMLRCSKMCAVVAAQFTNAITAPFIYAGTYYLGAKILDESLPENQLDNFSLQTLWDMGPSVFNSLWVGGLIIGTLLAIIGYFVVLGIDVKAHRQIIRARYQAKRQMERIKRKNAPALEKID